MATQTVAEKVKVALRITHSALNSEIDDNIAAAQAELVRAGVTQTHASDTTDALIVNAIKTYCLMRMARSLDDAEGYQKSWESQLDNLRKSSAYNTDSE